MKQETTDFFPEKRPSEKRPWGGGSKLARFACALIKSQLPSTYLQSTVRIIRPSHLTVSLAVTAGTLLCGMKTPHLLCGLRDTNFRFSPTKQSFHSSPSCAKRLCGRRRVEPSQRKEDRPAAGQVCDQSQRRPRSAPDGPSWWPARSKEACGAPAWVAKARA